MSISELVGSPQLLNCGKHVSEPSRAIAVAAKIGVDDDPHRKFIADGFEERLKARKKVVQEVTVGMAGGEPQRSSQSDRRRRANNETDSVLKIPSGRPGR
jgi:hypothetical protein